jgi:hypothetical protein
MGSQFSPSPHGLVELSEEHPSAASVVFASPAFLAEHFSPLQHPV